MQFLGKFGRIVCWRPPGELAPPPWGNPGSATDNHKDFAFAFAFTQCDWTFKVYVPTILIVMCSWLVFWVDIDPGSQLRFFLYWYRGVFRPSESGSKSGKEKKKQNRLRLNDTLLAMIAYSLGKLSTWKIFTMIFCSQTPQQCLIAHSLTGKPYLAIIAYSDIKGHFHFRFCS